MNKKQLAELVYYAAQECELQGSGELSVSWMINGWIYASEHKERITIDHIIKLGKLIEPRVNRNGLRQIDVRVGYNYKMPWQNVLKALEGLVASQPETHCSKDQATEFFREYEEIHPFRDGNGRTGSLLYNWIRGSIDMPVPPPNLWNDPRR